MFLDGEMLQGAGLPVCMPSLPVRDESAFLLAAPLPGLGSAVMG